MRGGRIKWGEGEVWRGGGWHELFALIVAMLCLCLTGSYLVYAVSDAGNIGVLPART